MSQTLDFDLVGQSIDELVLSGVRYIKSNGERISSRAGDAVQAYGINYILLDPRNRLHTLRQPKSIRYLCRELIAYFCGSLDVNDGLSRASSFWTRIADENGRIYSNYGFYAFHQKVNGKFQYEWILSVLRENRHSRRAIINYNQAEHKKDCSLDFPCAIASHYYIRNNVFYCVVYSRSEDIVTGLPYDLGFFSFLMELAYSDLLQSYPELKLGPLVLKCTFSQIYDQSSKTADQMLLTSPQAAFETTRMPAIGCASEVLQDIYSKTFKSSIMSWIKDHADF